MQRDPAAEDEQPAVGVDGVHLAAAIGAQLSDVAADAPAPRLGVEHRWSAKRGNGGLGQNSAPRPDAIVGELDGGHRPTPRELGIYAPLSRSRPIAFRAIRPVLPGTG